MRQLKKYLTGALFFILTVNYGYAKTIPFDSDRWEINAKQSRLEDYLGRKSLFLKGGIASIKDSVFTDGIIEFDIAFTPGERGFMGAVWRMQDSRNFEEFYMRPHQSGNPDANQYSPVFNGLPAWQLYYGEGYGAAVAYAFNEWIHVKIVVSGKQGEVYIKDMEQPALFIPELKREIKPGRVGLRTVVRFAPGHFSNFSFTKMNNPPLKGKAKKPEDAPEGTIMSWLISDTFGEKPLVGKFRLTKNDKEKLTWNRLTCERSGLANLSRLRALGKGKNSAFARVTIVSEKEQVKQLQFGFSDRVKVYFNDQLIYGGNNLYRSRDYRFLGTIGFFDELYLPLKKGENELWMAVSESFGGWGLKARFKNMEGIAVRE
jgi:hypothetical protein